MKNSLTRLLIMICSLALILASCNAGKLNTKAEETANSFYTALQKKNFDSALNYCSKEAFSNATPEDWKKAFELNSGLLGEIKSFTRSSSFNIATSTTSGTTVALAYDVQYQYGMSKDSVLLVKETDGSMKIYRYTWKHSNAAYMKELKHSQAEAIEYMDAVKAKNYDAAIALCSDDALSVTPKDKWAAFLDHTTERAGPITGYALVKDSSAYFIGAKGDAGKGNYYDIFLRSERDKGELLEKLVFFQKDYESPLKLAGHYIL